MSKGITLRFQETETVTNVSFCPLLETLMCMSACANGCVISTTQPWDSASDFSAVFYYTKLGSDRISDRFTRILRIFMWNKQCYTQSPGQSVTRNPPSRAENRTYGLHLLSVTHTLGPKKTSLFICRPAAGGGCRVTLQPTSEGGVKEVNPPHPAPHPTAPWVTSSQPGRRRLPGPHTSNRLTNYSQIKLTQAHLARCGDGRNYSAVRKIRLSGEWLPQMIIISSALVPPKQTLSSCPSSPVSSLKGQLDTCPTPRPIRSLSHEHHPVQGWWGWGGPGGRDVEDTAEALGTLTKSPSTEQWRGRSTLHPHLGQEQRKHLWPSRWPPGVAPALVQPAHVTTYNS